MATLLIIESATYEGRGPDDSFIYIFIICFLDVYVTSTFKIVSIYLFTYVCMYVCLFGA